MRVIDMECSIPKRSSGDGETPAARAPANPASRRSEAPERRSEAPERRSEAPEQSGRRRHAPQH